MPDPKGPTAASAFSPWLVWMLVAAILTLAALPMIASHSAQDPDDYMRLLQVRALLDGQGWFDSHQYRLDPPSGADMHWVRLVDLPIAAALALFRLFLAPLWAETAAMIAVPLGQLALAMWLLRQLMRELRLEPVAQLWALLLIPLFPLLSTNLMPMRIDHHGWQALAALAAVLLVLRGTWRAAALGGAITAAWLFISLEGVAMLAVIGAVYAWRYWQQASRAIEGFLFGLTLGAMILLAALIPPGGYTIARCDMVSWPHIMAFAAALMAAAALRVMPGQQGKAGRLLALVPIPLLAAPLLILPLGVCAVAPMAMVEPLVRSNWQAYLRESAPIWQQSPSAAAMLLALPVLIALGLRQALKVSADPGARAAWTTLGALALGASAIALLIMRGGIIAQLLALPFAGVMVAQLLPRARALQQVPLRIVATILAIAGLTPAFVGALAKPLDPRVTHSSVRHAGLAAAQPCDLAPLAALAALAPAHMFANLDITPELLVRTRHTAVAAGYHRNYARLRDVILAFGGPIDQARAIITANRAQYLIACKGSADLAGFANMGPDTLADRIYADQPVPWLEPIAQLSTGSLRVYRVK